MWLVPFTFISMLLLAPDEEFTNLLWKLLELEEATLLLRGLAPYLPDELLLNRDIFLPRLILFV